MTLCLNICRGPIYNKETVMVNTRAQACAILGISVWADINEAKKAYKKLVKVYHPDSGVVSDAGRYNMIVEAYDFLCQNTTDGTGSVRIIGNTTNSYYSRSGDYSSFQKKYEKKKAEDAERFRKNLEEFDAGVKKQEEEYKKAMEAINAIRVAEAIKAFLKRR